MKPKANIFDDIAFWILFGATFLLPLFFLPPSWMGLFQAKLALFGVATILALCFWIIERVRQGKLAIRLQSVYAFFVLIPFSYLVSSLLSADSHKSLIGSAFEMDTLHAVSLLFIYAFLISSLAREPKRAVSLAFAFFLPVFLAGLAQIVRIFAGDVFSFGLLSSPAFTLAGRWNDLTALLVVFLGGLLISLETIRLKKGAFAALLSLALLPFFFLSLSSITFDIYFWALPLYLLIGVFALVIFAYIFSLRRASQKAAAEEDAAPKDRFALPVPSLALLVFALTLLLFGNQIRDYLAQKTGVLYAEAPLTWQATYTVAAKALPDNPFFGSGPNTFSYDWNMSKPASVNNSIFWNTDIFFGAGVIPSALVTVGAVGFLCWILFYILIIGAAFKMLFSARTSPQAFTLKAIVAFAVVFTAFLMFFYTPGQGVVFAHFLFIGLLLALDANKKKEVEISLNATQWRHFATTLSFIICILAAGFWGWRIIAKSAAAFASNVSVAKSANSDEAMSYINKAIALDPNEPDFYQIAAQIYLVKVNEIAALPAKQAGEKTEQIKEYVSAMIANAEKAEAKDPINFRRRIVTGNVLEYLGSIGVPDATRAAGDKYISASALAPTHPIAFVLASNAYLAAGEESLARDALVKALTLKPDLGDNPDIQELALAINKAIAPVKESADKEEEESSE